MGEPVLLAIDSSTETLCLAACAGGREAVWHGPGGAQASWVLLDQVRLLLAELQTSLQALDAVAFARGPGAFTGLRTACSVAQGLALGAACRVLPIDSLLIVAEAARVQPNYRFDGQAVGVAMDARMGEVYGACYRHVDGQWFLVQAPCLAAPEVLRRAWEAVTPAAVAGTGLDLLARAPDDPAAVIHVGDHQRSSSLLRLAQAAWRAGEALPPEDALPLYLRDKVAQTTAERLAATTSARRGT